MRFLPPSRPLALLAASILAGALLAAGCGGRTVVDTGSASGGAPGCGPGVTRCGAVCVDVQHDPENCGACGVTCAAEDVCAGGQCTSTCPAAFATCAAGCVDLSADPANCGLCNLSCATGEVCAAGQCTVVCPGGLSTCAGGCADVQVDPLNCGACNIVCPMAEVCSDGHCTLVCGDGYTHCGDACADTQTDPLHCGACAHACAPGDPCVAGACVAPPPKCTPGDKQCAGGVPEVCDASGTWQPGAACAAPNLCDQGVCTSVPTTALRLWLRSDMGLSPAGGKVAAWADQSGLANDAQPPSVSQAPAVVPGALNGHPVVQFNGSTTSLVVANDPSLDFGTTLDFTVTVVLRAHAAIPYAGIVVKAAANGPAVGWQLVVRNTSSNLSEEILANGIAVPGTSSLDIEDSVYRIVTVAHQRSPGHVTAHANGALIQSQDMPELSESLSTDDPLRIGVERIQVDFLHGDIAEILIYATSLSDAARVAAETYLSAKYKIATADNPMP